jgi:hypothetical protein
LVSILSVASTKQTITLTSSFSAAASSTPPAVAVGELSPDVVATLVLLTPYCALSSDDVSDGSLDPLCAQEVLDINRQINARNHNSGIPSSSRHKLLLFLSRAQKRPLSLKFGVYHWELSPDIVATLILTPSCVLLSSDDISDDSRDPRVVKRVLNINRENRCETAQRHRYSKLFPAQTSLTSFQSTILSSSSSLSLSLSLKRKKKTEQNETNKQTLVSIIAVVVVQNIDERLNCLALQDKGERERERERQGGSRKSSRWWRRRQAADSRHPHFFRSSFLVLRRVGTICVLVGVFVLCLWREACLTQLLPSFFEEREEKGWCSNYTLTSFVWYLNTALISSVRKLNTP